MIPSDEKYFQSDEFQSLLRRYQESMRRGTPEYFDAADFADFSDYFVDHNQMDEAQAASERGLELHPTDEVLKVVHAGVLLLNGHYAEAAKIIRTIDNEASPDVIYLKGQLAYGRDHDIEAANACFEKWLKLQEKDYATDTQRAAEGKRDEDDEDDIDPEVRIRDAYLRVALSINDLAVSNEKAKHDLLPWVNRYLERFPSLGNDASDLDMLHLVYDAGLYRVMEDICKRFLDTNPYFDNLWTYLAYAQLMNGRTDEAATSADFALAINPSDAGALLVRGNCYYEVKNYQAAYDHLFQGHMYGNHSEDYRLACCLVRLGQIEQAVAFMDEYVTYLFSEENNSMDDDTLCELLGCLSREYLNCREPKRAFNTIEKALDVKPGDVDCVRMEGEIHLSMGNEKNAHTCFQYVLNNGESPYTESFNMAVIFLRYSYLKFSVAVFTQLVESDPSEKEFPQKKYVSTFLAYAFLLQKKMKEGIKWTKKALEDSPELFRDIIRLDVPGSIDNAQVADYILAHYPNGLSTHPDTFVD